jgi:serine/threonine protein kinase
LRPLRVQHETIIRAEIDILKAMNSPFICKLYLHGFSEDSHFLLLEFIEGGDMRKMIYAPGTCFNGLLLKYNLELFLASFLIYIYICIYCHLLRSLCILTFNTNPLAFVFCFFFFKLYSCIWL